MNKLGFYNENGFAVQGEGKHILENIKRILMTRRFRRVGDLSFGSDVRKYIFREEIAISDLLNEIRNSIIRCEPRVEVIDCSIIDFDRDLGILKIELKVRNKISKEIITTNLEV